MHSHSDIVIAGGGIAGLTCAAAFGSAGFDVICVDPKPAGAPTAKAHATAANAPPDGRTTAIWQPGQALLSEAGVWPMLAAHASPLRTMRIVDAGGPGAEARLSCAFDASELPDGLPFGWNLPNERIVEALHSRIAALPRVSLRQGLAAHSLLTRERGATVRLSNGERLRAALVIAADGRASAMRQAVGIGLSKTRFGQMALAFRVTHTQPHEGVSIEVHRSGGPFTLVPLNDQDNRPCSAVVWMDKGPKIKALAELGAQAFSRAMNARAAGVLGELTLASPRSLWPIVAQQARRLCAQRLALIAEAAHVVPPIGAQGLNMSLADISVLLQCAQQNAAAMGTPEMLAAYERRRLPEIRRRLQGVSLLNRASMAEAPALRDARAAGLRAIHAIAPLRKTLMRLGLGAP